MLSTQGILDIKMDTKMESMEQLVHTVYDQSKNWASDYDKHTRSWYQWNRKLLPHFTPELFDSKCSVKKASDSGRGKVVCFEQAGVPLILRHFNRGGWVRLFSRDRYFLPISSQTRVEVEVRLLLNLREKGLPVPEPVAFRVQRAGVACRMDIILKKISEAQNLVELLREHQAGENIWRKVGSTIADFHLKGVCHSDLNAHNVMVDANGVVWLVDFDKSCVLKGLPWLWQKLNLARLRRSLKKEARRNAVFQWTEQDWQVLLEGYRDKMKSREKKKSR